MLGRRLASLTCAYADRKGRRSGSDHWAWKGGRVMQTGYVRVRVDDAYVFEHRLVMAEHLGRPLEKYETVHHLNGDRSDGPDRELGALVIPPSERPAGRRAAGIRPRDSAAVSRPSAKQEGGDALSLTMYSEQTGLGRVAAYVNNVLAGGNNTIVWVPMLTSGTAEQTETLTTMAAVRVGRQLQRAGSRELAPGHSERNRRRSRGGFRCDQQPDRVRLERPRLGEPGHGQQYGRRDRLATTRMGRKPRARWFRCCTWTWW